MTEPMKPTRALGRTVALVVIALTVGTGLCPFDTDHAAGGDLCLSLLATTTWLVVSTPLTPTGRCLPAIAPAYYRYSPDLPLPPPKA